MTTEVISTYEEHLILDGYLEPPVIEKQKKVPFYGPSHANLRGIHQ